jgi:hypothetical protein
VSVPPERVTRTSLRAPTVPRERGKRVLPGGRSAGKARVIGVQLVYETTRSAPTTRRASRPGGCRAGCPRPGASSRGSWAGASARTGSPSWCARTWPGPSRPRGSHSTAARSRFCSTGGCASVTTISSTALRSTDRRAECRPYRPALRLRVELPARRDVHSILVRRLTLAAARSCPASRTQPGAAWTCRARP